MLVEAPRDATIAENKYFAKLEHKADEREREECEEYTRLLNEIQEDQDRRYTEWQQK